MPLHLHPLRTLPALADAAAAILRVPPPGDDPFAPDVLVVGGRGVEQWLRLALVERLDIVTNLEVWSPSRFVQDLERAATGRAPAGVSALTLEVLAAVQRDPALLPPELRHLRDAHGDASAAPAVTVPLAPAAAISAPLAAWATRMARTFERYQLYRPDVLHGWEQGADAADWQARLWRAAIDVAGRDPAPAEAHARTRRALVAGRVRGLAPRWLLVHQGRLAPLHLALAESLAAHREVHMLVHAATTAGVTQLVAPESAPAPHPLAARLDRARVDSLRAVASIANATPHPTHEHSTATRRTLLGTVQHTVTEYTASDEAPRAPASIDSADASLRVFACHGALRQVEVLKDALLGALHDDTTLEPRDILVLTPDPPRFVPLLQAVFPLGDSEGAPPLPLHVQGRSPRSINPVADVLLQLLTLAEERITASRVLALVERGPVAEAIGIAAADAPLVRDWFQQAGVRWGTDGDDLARADLGLADEGTWARGLTRVLLGTALLDDVSTDSNAGDTHTFGYAPVAGLEGERVLLAGRAVRAVRLLLGLVHEARTPRSLADWSHVVQQVLDTLVLADGAFATSVSRVRQVVDTLRHLPDRVVHEVAATRAHTTEHACATEHDRATRAPLYTAAALATLLEHRLEDVLGAPGRFGGIAVAPLTSGWARPARVIVLLGMDDELFPQRSSTPWFDRLAAAPRPGDPDERGEQLQTVFDALCMAQDRLVITYTGWNRAGTMRLPPSVAVSALQDVVHRVVARTGDDTPHDTWRRHVERDVPLQPFSRRAFEDATVPSFDALAAHTAQQLARGTRGAATGTGRRTATADQTASAGALVRTRDTLPLRTLLTFLERPAEEILSRLGVRLGHELTLVDDVLPLTMPRRDEAGAVTGMAHALLTERDIAVQLERLRHRDIMPPAALGRVWEQHATSKARYLAIRAHSAVGELPRRAREVLQVSVGHTTLTGTVDTRHGNTLLFLRDGKHNVVRMMRAFVTLCAAALGDSAVSHAVVVDADEITTLACPPDPAAVLRELVALYHDADRAVPPYVPASSLAYAEEIHKAISAAGVQATPDPETLARALEKARVTWDADDPSRPSECDEPANRLLHAVSPVEHPAFGSTARAVFLPMLAQVVGP